LASEKLAVTIDGVTPNDATAVEVLRHFPREISRGKLLALGNGGGFSGARIWRVETANDSWCLRAWPETGPTSEQLCWIHSLMQQARHAGLSFVPEIVPASDRSTVVLHRNRLWDLTQWMPGEADFHARPTPARLEAACRALALVHEAWKPAESRTGVCPAVIRRLDRHREWQKVSAAGWPVLRSPSSALDALAAHALAVLAKHMNEVDQILRRWTAAEFALQPCLCDIWHDHVLFDGDRVSGIIDFGSAKIDHVAVDLARLLGSLTYDKAELWNLGLTAYRSIHPLNESEVELTFALDRTGLIVAIYNWLDWVYVQARSFDDHDAVAHRLGELLVRAENWA
jgi:homoserine kinase type II